MQEASITFKGDFYFIGYYSKTVKNFIIYDGTFEKVNKDISPDNLIEKITKALDSFKEGVPHPEWKELGKIYKSNIKKLGYKTETEFNRGAKHCSITKEGTTIEISPTKCVPPKNYFSFLPKLNIVINSTESVEKIYAALMEALSRCE